jgi:hypothetical protein
MSRYLVQHDGLFLGSSSACNLVACIKLAQKMGWKDGQTIVTVLWVLISNFSEFAQNKTFMMYRCDSGNRHYSKVCFVDAFAAPLFDNAASPLPNVVLVRSARMPAWFGGLKP